LRREEKRRGANLALGHVGRDVESLVVRDHAVDLATERTEPLEMDDERFRRLVDCQLLRSDLETLTSTRG
jgi:hypothetical protein